MAWSDLVTCGSPRSAVPGGAAWSDGGDDSRSGPEPHRAPAGAARRWLARLAPEAVTSNGFRSCEAPRLPRRALIRGCRLPSAHLLVIARLRRQRDRVRCPEAARAQRLELADSGSTAVQPQGRLTATLLTLQWSDPNPHGGLKADRQPALLSRCPASSSIGGGASRRGAPNSGH